MSESIERLAEALAQENTRFAFGITGSGPSLSLITELEQRGVRYFDVPHEAAAAIMAGTIVRRTATPAVSISIKGPGFVNMLPGVAHNYFEGNGAISIAEAYGANAPAARKHKRLDQTSVAKPIVKAIANPSSSVDQLAEFIRFARSEAPGPVHIELADGHDAAPLPVTADGESGNVQDLVQAIQRASRPAVIVGSLALRRDWRDALRDLSVPVFTTAAAKSVYDEGLPHAAGVYTGDGKQRAPERSIMPLADLVVCIGVRGAEILSPWSYETQVIGLDEIAPAEGFPFSKFQCTNESAAFLEVLHELKKKDWGADECANARRQLYEEMARGGWLPFECFRVLQTLDVEKTLVCDTGSFCTIAEHAWHASDANDYVGSSNGRFMGVSLPMAVAVALSNDARPVICAVGDGGIRAYPAVMKLAVEHRLPVCLVLMRDGRYGSIAAAARGREDADALRIAEPSWTGAFAGMGIDTASARDVKTFEDSVSSWRRDAPLFIEAEFDADSYMRMTDAIR